MKDELLLKYDEHTLVHIYLFIYFIYFLLLYIVI